jgi:hypothetical protein
MKKLLSIAFAAMTLAIAPFMSCNKAGNVPNEEKLQLESPSGQMIAATASDLMRQTSDVLFELFGKKQLFELTNVEYLNVSKGYAAIVSFRLNDGTIGNYAIVEGVSFHLDSKSISTRKPARKTNDNTVLADDAGSRVSLVCQRTAGSNCQCKIQGTLDATTGTITWKCDCQSGCEMVVIIS